MNASLIACFVSLAALLLSPSAHAQLLRAVGVKGGINFSNSDLVLSNLDATAFNIETQGRTGWHAAGFVEWLNLPVVSVVTQVEYAQRGFTEEQVVTSENSPDPLGTFTLNTRLDYVSIPVLLKLRTSDSGAKPYVIAGPRFDFLVDRKTAYYYGDTQLNLDVSLVDAFNDRALGGTVGIGIATNALSLPLLLEARYNFDFQDNMDSEFLSAKNNAVDLWLGLSF